VAEELRQTFIKVASISLLVALTSSVIAQNRRHGTPAGFGVVEGRVLDARMHFLAGIRVYAESEGPVGILPVAITNKTGKFFLRLRPGKYELWPVREQIGFINLSHEFFREVPRIAKALVLDGQVTRGIVLQLPGAPARLVGRVIDAERREALAKARMRLCQVDLPSRCVETNVGGITPEYQTFRRLVPAVPLMISVSAPGYEDWYYGKDGSKENAEALQIAPNTIKELTILLRRNK